MLDPKDAPLPSKRFYSTREMEVLTNRHRVTLWRMVRDQVMPGPVSNSGQK